MPVQAIQHIRSLKGHTEPHLMLGDDGELYVVKLLSNISDSRQRVSEFIAASLARQVGLPVPECSTICVPRALVPETSDLSREQDAPRSGFSLHLCSRFVRSADERAPIDILPSRYLNELSNIASFWGILAFDKWCSNGQRRQAIFSRSAGGTRYTAHFIDQSQCFCGAAWAFSNMANVGLFDRSTVYRDITGWDSFEPFLSKLESIRPEVVWSVAKKVPSEWYDNQESDLESLVDSLLRRRSYIYELINRVRDANPQLFSRWAKTVHVSVPAEPRVSLATFASGTVRV